MDADTVRNWRFPELRQTYTERDTILYGLALGFGDDPENEADLRFVYEKNLQAMPTMAVVLCHPGFWISDPRTGIDARKAVHLEQDCSFHGPLPASGSMVGEVRVSDIVDRGPDRGAVIVTERVLKDADSGIALATIVQRTLCRADGGFTATTEEARPRRDELPARAGSGRHPEGSPDHVVDLKISPQAALLYRLSADPNPLHADPVVARAAGFARPILHGLCSYGIAARAIVQACCAGIPGGLKRLAVRFSAPTYPGETLRTEIWQSAPSLRFRCLALERGVEVMSNGIAEVCRRAESVHSDA